MCAEGLRQIHADSVVAALVSVSPHNPCLVDSVGPVFLVSGEFWLFPLFYEFTVFLWIMILELI